VRQGLRGTAAMPQGQWSAAVAALVKHVLEGAHHVWDTAETEAEAAEGGPGTNWFFVSFSNFQKS